jgi:predicted amidophosphoribosyltransferase
MARAAFPYTGWVGTAIRGFKYGDEWDRAAHLAGHMIPAARLIGPVDAVIPVPLHPHKLGERGYNQSALLATVIAQEIGVRLVEGLVRVRHTDAQAGLAREARLDNVRGAFQINPAWAPPDGQSYLLVDDVRTTSATLNACAHALRTTLPSNICALTLAFDVPASDLRRWLAERR